MLWKRTEPAQTFHFMEKFNWMINCNIQQTEERAHGSDTNDGKASIGYDAKCTDLTLELGMHFVLHALRE